MDAWLIATYVINSSDPVLPSGIGQVGDCGNTGRVIFSENYEDYRTGTRPSDYIIVYNGQGDSQQRVAAASGNKYLRTAGAPNWGLAMRKDFDFDLPAQISMSWRVHAWVVPDTISARRALSSPLYCRLGTDALN